MESDLACSSNRDSDELNCRASDPNEEIAFASLVGVTEPVLRSSGMEAGSDSVIFIGYLGVHSVCDPSHEAFATQDQTTFFEPKISCRGSSPLLQPDKLGYSLIFVELEVIGYSKCYDTVRDAAKCLYLFRL